MTYKETINWLFNQLPVFQNIGASAYKKDLTNTLLLVEHLNHPERNFKTIHVAGTNGKGSTSSMIASVFMEAGYKVGLYTSPHLKDFRERITINGKMISKNYVHEFVTNHKSFFENTELSFFEMTVGLAFEYFSDKKVDIAIIEVGMGGRLDSTNIITPLLSVITNIGKDHTQFLGNTLEKIAFEKAGIIKPNIPVVIGEYTLETKPVFLEIAKQNHSEIHFAQDKKHPDYPCGLLGDYQLKNKKTVIETFRNLKSDFIISEENIKNGILNVVQNTNLQGRWQVLQENPKVICDTAHNAHGLEIVMNQLKKEKNNQLHIVLGVVNDKDLDSILPLFPKNAIYYFCKPKIERGLSAKILQEKAATYNLKGNIYNSISIAYKKALANSDVKDLIYIGGSTFVVAEII
ncbi:bifunctional folylpolyglutamate synthase/dihydrofolate synthase [Flavobacterium sp. F372]|uniref:Dihydrofolate synthase/folylpolyglutamate synthase n=1 Tax=Flavobacterium bernardetii TaxID=2813823 RepID=A0ABR7J255_9FLAO|nr:folylpolyglutamate synthase/dihydrofolate synthase family protein [Flavobacterium bernardetii]MBC5836062.1 bifunctional folylpolyglutamate synthase/dihydrofolate synthase [Flavobacterium bernardetii]NHF71198.1 bifunctional folylpolyglutamate synthase/dihydrofolate synthase [Flavobacterium bernardetii]